MALALGPGKWKAAAPGVPLSETTHPFYPTSPHPRQLGVKAPWWRAKVGLPSASQVEGSNQEDCLGGGTP